MTALKEKYKPLLDFIESINATSVSTAQIQDKFHIHATVSRPEERDTIVEMIEEISGDMPADLVARIDVEETATMQNEKTGNIH